MAAQFPPTEIESWLAEALCVGFGGVAGEDLCDDFHGGQFFKYPDEVFPWADSADAAAFYQGIPIGVGFSGGFEDATGEIPV